MQSISPLAFSLICDLWGEPSLPLAAALLGIHLPVYSPHEASMALDILIAMMRSRATGSSRSQAQLILAEFDRVLRSIPREHRDSADALNVFIYTSHWEMFGLVTAAARGQFHCQWALNRYRKMSNSIRTLPSLRVRDSRDSLSLFRMVMNVDWKFEKGDIIPLQGQSFLSFSSDLASSYWFARGKHEPCSLLVLPRSAKRRCSRYDVSEYTLFDEEEIIVMVEDLRVRHVVRRGLFSIYIVSPYGTRITPSSLEYELDHLAECHMACGGTCDGWEWP